MRFGRALSVVLLQHANELGRPTATGPILFNERVEPHLRTSRWSWAGRADNERIAHQIDALADPVLLYPGGGAATEQQADAGSDYIILDGTWQEALAIFRKGPERLRTCRRVALAAGPSRYALRADYGWRDRLTSGDGAAEPLCTAETAAGLLEQAADDAEGGALVRDLLDAFQDEYAATHPHVHPHLARFAARRHEQPSGDGGEPLAGVRSCRWPERRFAQVSQFFRREGYRRAARPGDVVFVLRAIGDAARGGGGGGDGGDADADANAAAANYDGAVGDEPEEAEEDAAAARRRGAIVGAIRCTPCAHDPSLYLLQSLCIARGRRRRGLGRALVAAAVADLGDGAGAYCHCDEELVPLYAAAGFAALGAPPAWMAAEHERIAARRSKRGGGTGRLVLLARGVPYKLNY